MEKKGQSEIERRNTNSLIIAWKDYQEKEKKQLKTSKKQ